MAWSVEGQKTKNGTGKKIYHRELYKPNIPLFHHSILPIGERSRAKFFVFLSK
jgi:hypothetical protein